MTPVKRRYKNPEQILKAIDKARLREVKKLRAAEGLDSEADWLRGNPKMFSRINECRDEAQRLRDAALRSEQRRKRLGEKLSALRTSALFEGDNSIPA